MDKIITIIRGSKWSISLNTAYITSVEYHISYDIYKNEPDKGTLYINLVNGHTISKTWSWCGGTPFTAEEKYKELMKILKGETDDTEISF